VGLERYSLSLVRITEELLEWKSSGSWSRKPRLTAVGIRCSDHSTPIALTSPENGGCSVGIVRLRPKDIQNAWSERTSVRKQEGKRPIGRKVGYNNINMVRGHRMEWYELDRSSSG
jgi:hypothetical protein